MDNNIGENLLLDEEENRDLKGRVVEESKKIWKVALPTAISCITSFGIIVVTQSFIGHLNSVDLAGYALVQTLIVRFATGIVLGMSSAIETLCGQAYGAKQYHMMGIYLQRSWLIDLSVLTIFVPIFVFARPMFKLLGQEDAVAESAGRISLWFLLYPYSTVFTSTIQAYLQSQQKNAIIAWLSVMQFAVHIPLSWLFVCVADWGVNGAMAALSVSSWLLVFGEFVYIFGGWCPDSWKGFSMAAFKDIFPVFKLSISSGIMLCLELWYTAILVLLAGYMKNAEIAISAFSICLNVSSWEFMLILGFTGAAVVRVANELGRGDAKATKFSIKVMVTTSLIIVSIFFIVCLLFGNKLGHLFSKDEQVVKAVSDLSFLLAFTMLLNGIYPVLSGVAIGAGLQTKVAIINLVCYYGIGIPIGAMLGYAVKLQLKGIWIGMICGVVAETLSVCYMTWKTNWDEEVLKTSERLKKWFVKSCDDRNKESS
ncbi:hypothetical protein ACS0TY_024660 [Phlomoides rotata]